MIDYDDFFGGLTEEEYEEQTKEHFEWLEKNCRIVDGDAIAIRVPKVIARVKMCGGALTFEFNDTMQFEMPTKEQCENLKKTFGIEVELVEE